MSIVKEHINFKRGQSSKKSLNVGNIRMQPTVYLRYSSWWEKGKEELLDNYQKKYHFLEYVDYYDIFLIDRLLSNFNIQNQVEDAIDDGTNMEMFGTLGQLIGGVEDTQGLGQPIFHILWKDPKEWVGYDIEDLRVITANGGNSAVNIVDVV